MIFTWLHVFPSLHCKGPTTVSCRLHVKLWSTVRHLNLPAYSLFGLVHSSLLSSQVRGELHRLAFSATQPLYHTIVSSSLQPVLSNDLAYWLLSLSVLSLPPPACGLQESRCFVCQVHSWIPNWTLPGMRQAPMYLLLGKQMKAKCLPCSTEYLAVKYPTPASILHSQSHCKFTTLPPFKIDKILITYTSKFC